MTQIGFRALSSLLALVTLGFATPAFADVAPASASGGWFTTGIWILAAFAAVFVVAFLVTRLLPKSDDDNSDNLL